MEPSIEEGFGELRSLMQRDDLSEPERAELYALIEQAAQLAPQEYRERWIGYMRGFPHHFEAPLATLSRLTSLRKAHALAPHALFHLELNHRGIGDKRIRILANSSRFAQLCSLDLAKNIIGDEGARVLARSPHIAKLISLNLERKQNRG